MKFMSAAQRKLIIARSRNSRASAGGVGASKPHRKRSPRKLEPHEVVAMLKARKVSP